MFYALQNPLGWCWLIWLAVTLALMRRSRRWLALLSGGACLLLSAFGGTPLSAWLLSRLEREAGSAQLPPRADAVVVLGGSYGPSSLEPSGFKVHSGFDRVTTGISLIDRGISTNLVLGGGIGARARLRIHASEALRPWLTQRLPSSARLHVIDSSATTREEALHFAPMAVREGWREIVLVTSASHLPRATTAFQSVGVVVHPVGCAFEGQARLDSADAWSIVPNVGNLNLAGMWVHEQIGSLYYKLRGWSTP